MLGRSPVYHTSNTYSFMSKKLTGGNGRKPEAKSRQLNWPACLKTVQGLAMLSIVLPVLLLFIILDLVFWRKKIKKHDNSRAPGVSYTHRCSW